MKDTVWFNVTDSAPNSRHISRLIDVKNVKSTLRLMEHHTTVTKVVAETAEGVLNLDNR
jgi:hypothetical protein